MVYLWIMDESSTLAIGRQISRGDVFQTFDNGLVKSAGAHLEFWFFTYSLSRAVESDDESQRSMELDRLAPGVVEGPDAGNT